MKTQILIVSLLLLVTFLVSGCQVCTKDIVYMCNPSTEEFRTAPSSCGYNMHAMKSRVLPELIQDVNYLKTQDWLECSEVFTPDQMGLFTQHLHKLREEIAKECELKDSILLLEECIGDIFLDPRANPFNFFS